MATSVKDIELERLPLQKQLILSCVEAFEKETDVLVGSLAKGTADRVSDADIAIFTSNNAHKILNEAFSKFESKKEIFYTLSGVHNENASFKKYRHNFRSSNR